MKATRFLYTFCSLLVLSSLGYAQLSFTTNVVSYCNTGKKTTYSNWAYKDSYGTHHFQGSSSVSYGPYQPCNVTTGFKASSTDGELYYLQVTGAYGSVTAPTITQGYVNPRYVILGVTYAPPGPSSFVQYCNDTLVGSTTSLASSFASSVTYSVAITRGIQGWINGSVSTAASTTYAQQSDTGSSVTVSKQTSVCDQTPGPANPYIGINHDFDVIWLWLNPVETFSTFTATVPASATVAQWNGHGYSTLDQPTMDVYPVLVGWLNGDIKMTSSQAAPLARTWAANEVWPTGEGPGLTATDFQDIEKADPYWDCTPNPSTCPTSVDPTRFTLTTANSDFVYQQAGVGAQPGTQTYTETYTNTTTQNQGSTYTYSRTIAMEASFSGSKFLAQFTLDLGTSKTLTWQHSINKEITSTNSSSALLSITGAPCNVSGNICNPIYNGPTQFDLYQDVLFGSFLLNAVN